MPSGPPFVPPCRLRRMMKARVAEGQSYGKWADEWVEHPTPTMNEPHRRCRGSRPRRRSMKTAWRTCS